MAEPVDREVEVLVAGAGPTGLTLACALRRHGADCLLIDQDEGPTPLHESRALGLHARTLEVFERLGAAARMEARGRPVRAIGLSRRGRRVAGFRLAIKPEETRFPHVLILPQGRVERVLIDRLAELGGGAPSWRTRLVSFKPDAAGALAVLKESDEATTRVRARWLIGCDGPASVVRHGLGLAFEGGEYPERFLLADVRLDWSAPTDEGTGLLTPEGLVLALPLPDDGWWRLIDATGAADIKDPDAILARFRTILSRSGAWGGSARISEARWVSSFLIHRRIVDRYRAGRCFVAGDAAHLHSPVGGQGLNIGVQDAANLAWKLALVVRGEAPESLLDSYDAERRPAARAVLRGTDWATRLLTSRNLLVREARNLLVRVLDGNEMARRRLSEAVSGLGVSARKSPIVAEAAPNWLQALWRGGYESYQAGRAFDQGPRPGDRMPDPKLATADPETGRERRLSDVVFRSDLDAEVHVLLVFQGVAPGSAATGAELVAETWAAPPLAGRIRPILVEPTASTADATRWAGERLADPDSALHQRFGAVGACVYLIRPDGCIAFRGRPIDPAALRDYLSLVFR